jgi:hypothetical protein
MSQTHFLFLWIDYLPSASAGETSSSRTWINCLYVINPSLKTQKHIRLHSRITVPSGISIIRYSKGSMAHEGFVRNNGIIAPRGYIYMSLMTKID